jgi:hypothetical protein
VCEKTKGKQAKHTETWWWNEMSEAIKTKWEKFKAFKKSKSEVDKAAYNLAKKEEKKIIDKVKNSEYCVRPPRWCRVRYPPAVQEITSSIPTDNNWVLYCGD